MKHVFTLIILFCFTIGATMAQNNTSTTRTKVVTSKEVLKKDSPETTSTQNNTTTTRATVVTSKEALKKVAPETTPAQKAQVERKMETSKRIEATQTRPVIEMTDEYIDNQISEIQKVIDKNAGNEDFNLSGYQKRILYLESRRPKK